MSIGVGVSRNESAQIEVLRALCITMMMWVHVSPGISNPSFVNTGDHAWIGAALGVIMLANILEGGSPGALFLMPPMLLVFGGTICVCIAGGTLGDAKHALGSIKTALFGKVASSSDVVPVIVSLSDAARREGLTQITFAAQSGQK